jgi:hypothetical protein
MILRKRMCTLPPLTALHKRRKGGISGWRERGSCKHCVAALKEPLSIQNSSCFQNVRLSLCRSSCAFISVNTSRRGSTRPAVSMTASRVQPSPATRYDFEVQFGSGLPIPRDLLQRRLKSSRSKQGLTAASI